MVRFLISVAYFEVWRLLEGGTYSDMSVKPCGAYLKAGAYYWIIMHPAPGACDTIG